MMAPWKKDFPWAKALFAAVALTPTAVFVVQFFLRFTFPGHLEIMEGQTLFHAWRVARGLPLYVEPSLSAISPPYFPLYYHVVALLMKIAGPQWWTGRLVSFLSAMATGALFYLIGRRESGSRLWGLAAAGLFFGAYGLTGAYYDLFRVDSLPLALGFAAFVLAVYGEGRACVPGSAALIFLSVMAKQSQIYLIPVIAIAFWPKGRARAAVFLALSVALCAAGVALYNRASHGWLWKYAIDMVSHHRIIADRYFRFLMWLLAHFAVPIAVTGFYAIGLLAERRFKRFFSEPWFYFAGASCISSILIWRIEGAYWNSLIPAAMGLIGAFAAFGPRIYSAIAERLPRLSNILKPLAFVGLAAMLALEGFPFALGHPLWRQAPSRQMRSAARKLNRYIRDYPGVVYMPFYVMPANPNWQLPHNVPLRDLAGSPWGGEYYRKILRDLAETKVDAVIMGRGRVPSRFDGVMVKCEKGARLPSRTQTDPGPLTRWPNRIHKCGGKSKPGK